MSVAERQTRTKSALALAVLELAAETPIADITVTALAQRAGITRETFYKHSSGIVDVLADSLASELAIIGEANNALPATLPTGDSVFRRPTEQLVEHLVARANVYRNAMNPRLDARIRELLTEYISLGLLTHLDAHPEIAPSINGRAPDAFGRVALAAYAAAGTVGVLEEWLARVGGSEAVDHDELTEVILAAAPEWWQGKR